MIKNFFKGFIIGIGKIIPGVSGSMLAISLGVYEKVLTIIANIKNMTMNRFMFLFPLALGFLFSVSTLSGSVKWLLDHFYFPIMLLFIGLIIGGVPDITNEIKKRKINIKDVIVLIVAFVFCYMLSNVKMIEGYNNNNLFIYFILGLIEAFSSIVPGISGTAIYMSLGYYELLLDFFSNLFNPLYFKFGLFFSLGLIIGIILIAKIITFLLTKHKISTYYAILGFMFSSIIIMFKMAYLNISSSIFNGFVLFEILLGFFLLIVGYKLTIKINKLFSNK